MTGIADVLEKPRLDLLRLVSHSKHARILAPISEILPRRRRQREGPTRVADGGAERSPSASSRAEATITMNVAIGPLGDQNEWRSTPPGGSAVRGTLPLPAHLRRLPALPAPIARDRALGGQVLGGQAAYDLARLKGKRLIFRVTKSHRYKLTELGMRMATIFTEVHSQVLCAGLTPELHPDHPPTPLNTAYRAFQKAVRQNLVGSPMAA